MILKDTDQLNNIWNCVSQVHFLHASVNDKESSRPPDAIAVMEEAIFTTFLHEE